MNLDDLRQMHALDTQGFLRDVDTLPDQMEQAWSLAQSYSLPDSFRDVRNIIIAGMGGSAIGGSLVQAYVAPECRLPISVLRDYSLPASAGPETLIIASSHSGNTEETLATCQAALARGARLLAITRGGALGQLAREKGLPVWRFEHAGQPRAAVGFSFMLTLGVLLKLGLVANPSAEVAGAIAAMRDQQQRLSAEVAVTANPAKRLAGQLMDRIPLIFGADHLAPVARRWKGQINEVAKAMAVYDELPEMDHNSVVGTMFPEMLIGKFMALFLRSGFEHARNARRAEITREIYMAAGFNTDAVEAAGPSRLAHMLTSLHYGDYASYYLAIAYDIDPSPIPQIDYLKQQLTASAA